MFLYAMDRFVWLLLIAVFTATMLQVTGLVEAPKSVNYDEGDWPARYQHMASLRTKRQSGNQGTFVDQIFKIPIATLQSVSELLQNSAPAIQRIRDSVAQRRVQLQQQQQAQQRRDARAPNQPYDTRPQIQPDGSSSKVLLTV